jgi:hypothetical protein
MCCGKGKSTAKGRSKKIKKIKLLNREKKLAPNPLYIQKPEEYKIN